MFSAPLVLKETRPLARAQDRLLGPCFKTGPGGTSILSLPIDGPRCRVKAPRRTRGNPSRARLHTTCSKPHLAAQAFGTERRYCGASNRGKHQGATVGRPARPSGTRKLFRNGSQCPRARERQVPCGAGPRCLDGKASPAGECLRSDNRVQRA